MPDFVTKEHGYASDLCYFLISVTIIAKSDNGVYGSRTVLIYLTQEYRTRAVVKDFINTSYRLLYY